MDQPLSAHAGACPRAQKATNPTRTDRAFDCFTVLFSPRPDSGGLARTRAGRSGFLRAGAGANLDATVEIDAGRCSLGLVELKIGSLAETHRRGNQVRWKTLNQCVQVADHRVVIAPGVLNVVLNIHQRLLQFLEVLRSE